MYGHVGSFLSTGGLHKLPDDACLYMYRKVSTAKVSNHAHACEIMRFSIAHHAGSEEEWLQQEDDRAAAPPQPYS